MSSKLAVALYLGESYATLGLFDISNKSAPAILFEKSAFLPQVSLKSLLNQTKQYLATNTATDSEVPVYIVSKYFDRLRQFRLGGSISQVILKGFENSYTLTDSKALSLAAAQLIITVNPKELSAEYLSSELARIKKINPDLNKAVIAVPPDQLSSADSDLLSGFFRESGLKIFTCPDGRNQNMLRKTLLNAGSEGTKEEIISDVHECLGEQCRVYFYTRDAFENSFENCSLFGSAGNFLSRYIRSQKKQRGAYFDIETLRISTLHLNEYWSSPWGMIPVPHYNQIEIGVHPFSEVKLNHLSLISTDLTPSQLEPGPVIAGRAIKPLMIDLFYQELAGNEFIQNLFPQITQDNIRAKINNLLSVLEKGQKNSELSVSLNEFRQNILSSIAQQLLYHNLGKEALIFGPLSKIFAPPSTSAAPTEFSWSHEIIKLAVQENN